MRPAAYVECGPEHGRGILDNKSGFKYATGIFSLDPENIKMKALMLFTGKIAPERYGIESQTLARDSKN